MDRTVTRTKLIWIGEYDTAHLSVSEAQQGDFIDDFMDTWSTLDGVGPMFIYSLVDQNSGSTEVEDTWEPVCDDWTPKQAAAVVRNWIAEHGGAFGSAADRSGGSVTAPR